MVWLVQMSVPEAVLQIDREEVYFSEAVDTSDFDAVGIGPGIGIHENTAIALIAQIRRTQCPTVLDADALNILANHRAWMQQLPKDLIMTPHPKELDRLAGGAGTSDGCYERLSKARELAQHIRAYILLKDHYSALCMPDGRVFFNQTGNSGMATAGSGDVLTGIITGLCELIPCCAYSIIDITGRDGVEFFFQRIADCAGKGQCGEKSLNDHINKDHKMPFTGLLCDRNDESTHQEGVKKRIVVAESAFASVEFDELDQFSPGIIDQGSRIKEQQCGYPAEKYDDSNDQNMKTVLHYPCKESEYAALAAGFGFDLQQ